MRDEIKVTAVKRDAEDSLHMLTHALQSFRCADNSGRTARSTLRESGTDVLRVKLTALAGPRNVLFEPVEHRRRSVRIKEIGYDEMGEWFSNRLHIIQGRFHCGQSLFERCLLPHLPPPTSMARFSVSVDQLWLPGTLITPNSLCDVSTSICSPKAGEGSHCTPHYEW